MNKTNGKSSKEGKHRRRPLNEPPASAVKRNPGRDRAAHVSADMTAAWSDAQPTEYGHGPESLENAQRLGQAPARSTRRPSWAVGSSPTRALSPPGGLSGARPNPSSGDPDGPSDAKVRHRRPARAPATEGGDAPGPPRPPGPAKRTFPRLRPPGHPSARGESRARTREWPRAPAGDSGTRAARSWVEPKRLS